MRIAGTPVPAHGEQQRRRTLPERLMSQLAGHGIPYLALLEPQRRHHESSSVIRQASTAPVGPRALPVHLQPELVEAAERRQVRTSGGSVRHVEDFRMRRVGTFILGDLDLYPGNDAATTPTPSSAKGRFRFTTRYGPISEPALTTLRSWSRCYEFESVTGSTKYTASACSSRPERGSENPGRRPISDIPSRSARFSPSAYVIAPA